MSRLGELRRGANARVDEVEGVAMQHRLRPHDVALLEAETARTPLHNATLEIFEPGDSGFDYERLMGVIEDRIAFVSRYRQRLRVVPGRLGTPVWVDDEDFDLAYHVRRSALPRPGSMAQLRDLVGRIMSRRLDRTRPLWEVYFIEGVEGDRVALFTKSHQVLVDGSLTVDLGQVLLDLSPEPRETISDEWHPRPEPSGARLALSAVGSAAAHPGLAVDAGRANLAHVARRAGHVVSRVGEVAGALSNRSARNEALLGAGPSEQRRLVTVRTDLDSYRQVREVHGGTVNDVILATIAGGLRSWLMTRRVPLPAHRHLHAMVPMSVLDENLAPTSLGAQVAGHELDLPIGETSPVVRLHQVSYALRAHKETGKSVAANRLAGIPGFAPTTFHALGTRVAIEHMKREFDLVVTNVPGPQFPLYAGGARMVETYPVPPLLPGFALSIGVTSYDGSVFFGLTADRDAVPDADLLGDCLTEALEELVDSASDLRARAPRGRRSRRRTPPPEADS